LKRKEGRKTKKKKQTKRKPALPWANIPPWLAFADWFILVCCLLQLVTYAHLSHRGDFSCKKTPSEALFKQRLAPESRDVTDLKQKGG